MSAGQGISFLWSFDLGNRNVLNPGINILSVTSTAPGDYDKANLTTESLRHVWRSGSVLTWQDIIIKAELISSIDTFAILGHNLSPTAVVRIEANVSNNFIAPPVSKTVPWTKDNMVSVSAFGGNYQYYRVRILDPSNACGYIEVGRIVGGVALTIKDEDITDEVEILPVDMADKVKTEGFFQVSNDKVVMRELSIKFEKTRGAAGINQNFLKLLEMFNEVRTTKPFLTIVDRSNPSFCILWGVLDRLPNQGYTILQFVSQSLKIIEEF